MIVIREKFVDYIKDMLGIAYPVYQNPSSQEIKDLLKDPDSSASIRFCIVWNKATTKKDVYVWSWLLIHDNVAKKLDIDYPINYRALFGDADRKGNRWVANSHSYQLSKMYSLARTSKPDTKEKLKDYFSLDWSNSYIDIIPIKKEMDYEVHRLSK